MWRLKKSDVRWFRIFWKRQYTLSLNCWFWDCFSSLSIIPLILTAASFTIWYKKAKICMTIPTEGPTNKIQQKQFFFFWGEGWGDTVGEMRGKVTKWWRKLIAENHWVVIRKVKLEANKLTRDTRDNTMEQWGNWNYNSREQFITKRASIVCTSLHTLI